VDETVKTLISTLAALESEIATRQRDIEAIKRALAIVGVKPDSWTGENPRAEKQYVRSQPFAAMSLSDACLKILQDQPGEWFSKKQVEYLLERGGYESSAKDPTNSVEVTLRHIADSGRCSVNRQRGSAGNRYSVEPGGENVVTDSGATKSTKTGE
jgi:hypothetical protein